MKEDNYFSEFCDDFKRKIKQAWKVPFKAGFMLIYKIFGLAIVAAIGVLFIVMCDKREEHTYPIDSAQNPNSHEIEMATSESSEMEEVEEPVEELVEYRALQRDEIYVNQLDREGYRYKMSDSELATEERAIPEQEEYDSDELIEGIITFSVESVHTGERYTQLFPHDSYLSAVSFWASQILECETEVEISRNQRIGIIWVVVQIEACDEFEILPDDVINKAYGCFLVNGLVRIIDNPRARLNDIALSDSMMVHIYSRTFRIPLAEGCMEECVEEAVEEYVEETEEVP